MYNLCLNAHTYQNGAAAAKKIQELSKFVDSGNLKNLNELDKKMGPLASKCLDLNDKEQVRNYCWNVF